MFQTRQELLRRLAIVLAGGLLALSCTERPPPPPEGAPSAARASNEGIPHAVDVVYNGRLGAGWEDWGWGEHDLSSAGPARVKFNDFGGIILKRVEPPPPADTLVFRYKAPPSYGTFLVVTLRSGALKDETFPRVRVSPENSTELPDGWKKVAIPVAELNPNSASFDRIVLQASSSVGGDWVLLDRFALVDPKANAVPGAPARSIPLAIHCSGAATPINPLIYGIAHGVITSGETAHRVGGNPMSRLNWEAGNLWNTGSDWFYENVQADNGLSDWIDDAHRDGIRMAVTVPMIGWVAKDGTSVGFAKARFGEQRKHDPNRPEAGDGHRPDGTPIPPGPPTLTSVQASPETIGKWVAKAREKDRKRGARGIHMYILDNEPGLWHITHRDVHPEPVGYDELLERTIAYGTAIRRADPEAVIAGPAAWGWPQYFTSAKDEKTLFGADRAKHGGAPLLAWYLKKLAEHEKKTGVRVLDVLDVHYYPQAEGIAGPARTDPEGTALRIRQTRSLWDPSYKDESWIGDTVRLIPRLKEWIEENYPGRGISLGEWSFGAEGHVSGALATAEALGRFGQQGLTAAFYWASPREGSATYHGFRGFRNFDGKGGRFLDFSVPTREAPGVSLFASRDASGKHVVAVALNLDPKQPVRATIDVSECGAATDARAFVFDAGSTGFERLPLRRDRVGFVEPVLPPYSITVVDLDVSPARE